MWIFLIRYTFFYQSEEVEELNINGGVLSNEIHNVVGMYGKNGFSVVTADIEVV